MRLALIALVLVVAGCAPAQPATITAAGAQCGVELRTAGVASPRLIYDRLTPDAPQWGAVACVTTALGGPADIVTQMQAGTDGVHSVDFGPGHGAIWTNEDGAVTGLMIL